MSSQVIVLMETGALLERVAGEIESKEQLSSLFVQPGSGELLPASFPPPALPDLGAEAAVWVCSGG